MIRWWLKKKYLLIICLLIVFGIAFFSNLKNDHSPKIILPVVKKTLSNKIEPNRLKKDELPVNQIPQQLSDLSGEEASKIIFPNGVLKKRIKLDEDGSYAEILHSSNGDEITRVYSEGVLSSEKWLLENGNSLGKSWGEGRLIAFSYKLAKFSSTTFFDHSMLKTKRIEESDGNTICIKYDDNGEVLGKYKDRCKDDDFRELLDQNE